MPALIELVVLCEVIAVVVVVVVVVVLLLFIINIYIYIYIFYIPFTKDAFPGCSELVSSHRGGE